VASIFTSSGLTGNVFYSRSAHMQLPFDLNPDPRICGCIVGLA
jgi:hypothetical protein